MTTLVLLYAGVTASGCVLLYQAMQLVLIQILMAKHRKVAYIHGQQVRHALDTCMLAY